MEDRDYWASLVVQVVKNPPANAKDIRDAGLIPGLGRFPGGWHGNPLQYSCLENPTDKGIWWATVYGVAQNRTQLKRLRTMHHQSQQLCVGSKIIPFTLRLCSVLSTFPKTK